ncbi:MAG: tetratricopeptide repeat protein [Treponema sp.]|nr:tetratricopeptide repeat protein [Treponema sp.]
MNCLSKMCVLLVALAVLAFSCGTSAAIAAPAVSSKKEPVSQEVRFAQNLNAALEKGSVDDALKLFENLPEDSRTEETDALKASLLLSAGREAEAEGIAQELLTAHPDDVNVLQLNVMVAKQKGDARTKSALIKKILTIDPRNAGANIELGSEAALKHRYRDARDFFQKATFSEPNNTEALFGYAKMSYYLQKDDDARRAFEKILKIDPSDAAAYAYLGKLEGEVKRYKAALEYINKALALDPDNTTYYLDKGTYSRFTGDYKGAEAAWKKAVENDPDYFLGYAYLAGLYDEQEMFDKALGAYRKVVEKNPQYYYAYESLGMFAWHSGSWGEARAAFEKALAKKSDSVSYALMIAACYSKEGNVMQSKKFLEGFMKGLDRQSLDYAVVRLYHDRAGDGSVLNKVVQEKNSTIRGKMLYYMALFYELQGKTELAQKYYVTVSDMEGARFFEYRLAQWSIQK